MYMTDMHASNSFVDRDWNIKHIIDLEWACSLPLELVMVPHWLTGKGVDQLGPEYERFEHCYRQFFDAIRQEETNAPLCYKGTTYSLSATMNRTWEQHHYWYLSALQSPKGLFNLFRGQLQPLYEEPPKESLCPTVFVFWAPGMSSFVNSKLDDLTQYLQEVRDIFNSDKSGGGIYAIDPLVSLLQRHISCLRCSVVKLHFSTPCESGIRYRALRLALHFLYYLDTISDDF